MGQVSDEGITAYLVHVIMHVHAQAIIMPRCTFGFGKASLPPQI